MPKLTFGVLAALGAAALTLPAPASGADGGEPIDDDASLVEVAAYVQARSAFQRHCHHCHTATGDEANKKSIERLDMARYPFAGKRGPTAGKAVRQALGAGDGAKPSMPKDDPGTVQGDDLAAILRWADTFDAVRAPKDKGSST